MTRPSDATRSSGTSRNNGSSSSVPDGRASAPPQGVRPGLPRPPGPRFAPPPPPGRRLTSAQGVRLGLIWLVIVVLGAAAGIAATLPMTKLYSAQLSVEYNVSQQDASDNLRTDRALTTQAVLLTSRSVLGPVADSNGVDAEQLAKNTTATVLAPNGPGSPSSEIVQVSVLDPDPATAVKLANAIGQQYLKVVAQSSPAVYISDQINDAKNQLNNATPAQAAALQSRITTLQGQLDLVNISGNRAKIAVPAYALSSPVSPNQLLAAATGAFCGIVVACLVAIGMSRRWTRG
jgi:capsular polysaccharide biosynthesis protein